MKKMREILETKNINNYKNLRKPMQDFKRVRIGSDVLTFKFIKPKSLVVFYDLDHHDKIYKR
jgi:mRNA-degrading endonuclease RelE of RelBE toxin-antitoxin system